MTYVFLFDIDLTMIRTNGAGSAAMDTAMREMLDVEGAFAGMQFAGRTDRAILREALTTSGRLNGDFDRFCTDFEACYLPHLAREMQERRGLVLPGVRETLAAVSALPDARLGLATGNFRRAAEVKLRHFDLWDHFLDGGFADDGEERASLVAAAVRRVAGEYAMRDRVFVIGDSPHDILAARANGLVAVGVCTGQSVAEQLLGAGADVILEDLSDPEAMLDRLFNRTGA